MVTKLATADEFEARHGTLDADEKATVEVLIEDASALIFDEAEGSSKAWVTSPASNDPPHKVKQVCLAAVYRAWSNPDALAQMSMDQTQFTYARGDGAGQALFLTNGEARRVRKAAATSGFQATTLVSPWSS